MLSPQKAYKKNTIVHVSKKDRVDVLLVYPIWASSEGRVRLQRMLPPLGILSIASYLEEKDFEVHVLDLHAEQLSPEDFRSIIRVLKPRIVGMTVLAAHFIPAHYAAAICKQEIDDVKVYVGGPHAESNPEQMLQNKNIDAVCQGDGEEIMLDLALGLPYEKILGLAYRGKDGKVVSSPPRPIEHNLDKYPFPAYHLIDFDNYFPAIGTYRDLPAANVLMTRGCPGKCTFCNSANTELRSRSVDKMIELIKRLRYEYGMRQINFYDDTFTANIQSVRAICQKLIDEKIDIKFVCYVRGDMMNESLARLLAKAGCHQLLIGIESGSKLLREKINKPINEEKYKETVRLAHKYGMEVRGSFIIGHIDETKETLRETLQSAINLDVDYLQPCIMTPYPGTQLYREAKQDHLLEHEHYEFYGQGQPILKMKHLTHKDIMWFQTYSFFRFYFRPKSIWRQLKSLKHWAHVTDLFSAFYIILIEGISSRSKNRLKQWMDFDLNSVRDPLIKIPEVSRLTWEVRAGKG